MACCTHTAARLRRAPRHPQSVAHPARAPIRVYRGGTGIAPLRSMLWHTLLAERDGHSSLIYSVRAPEEFAYMEEFQRLEDERRIDFRHTVTRTAAEGWLGRQGRIGREMSGWIDRAGRNAVLRLRAAGADWRNPPAAERARRRRRSDPHRRLGVIRIGRLVDSLLCQIQNPLKRPECELCDVIVLLSVELLCPRRGARCGAAAVVGPLEAISNSRRV